MHLVCRLLWLSVLLIGVSLAGVTIYKQVIHLRDNPVTTNIKIHSPKKLPFPAIALCNLNQDT